MDRIETTLCLLKRDNKILLAMKKRGFGKGKYNGIGGKIENNETPEQAMIRETQEEINVTPIKYEKVGIVEFDEYYKGKNIALIFEKTSTRTRCAFEVAAHDLGMGSTYLDPTGSQIGKKESIADTARVLGRMYEGIEYRGFGQDIVEELAKYAGVPVWNGLTNEYHPTQMLADMLTIREHFGDLKGRRLVYMGDARYNMGNSLMIACSKLGMHFVACTTKKYFPNQELVDLCKTYAEAFW